jgi:hypothetical protein
VQRARKLVEGTKRVLAASLDQEQRVRIVVPSMIRIFGSVVTLLLQDDSYDPSLLPAAMRTSRESPSGILSALGLTPPSIIIMWDALLNALDPPVAMTDLEKCLAIYGLAHVFNDHVEMPADTRIPSHVFLLHVDAPPDVRRPSRPLDGDTYQQYVDKQIKYVQGRFAPPAGAATADRPVESDDEGDNMPLDQQMARVIAQVIAQQHGDVAGIRMLDMQTGETQDVTEHIMTMIKGKGKGKGTAPPPGVATAGRSGGSEQPASPSALKKELDKISDYLKQENNRTLSDKLNNLVMAFKFPYHFNADTVLEKTAFAQGGKSILKDLMMVPLGLNVHLGDLLGAYHAVARKIMNGIETSGDPITDEKSMQVQVYYMKYLARLFFKVTKTEDLAVFTPVEGETDDVLTARIQKLMMKLRDFFRVDDADAADELIKERILQTTASVVQEMAHEGAAAMATAMASAAAAAPSPVGVATAGQPGEDASTASAARAPVPFSGQGRRLD